MFAARSNIIEYRQKFGKKTFTLWWKEISVGWLYCKLKLIFIMFHFFRSTVEQYGYLRFENMQIQRLFFLSERRTTWRNRRWKMIESATERRRESLLRLDFSHPFLDNYIIELKSYRFGMSKNIRGFCKNSRMFQTFMKKTWTSCNN